MRSVAVGEVGAVVAVDAVGAVGAFGAFGAVGMIGTLALIENLIVYEAGFDDGAFWHFEEIVCNFDELVGEIDFFSPCFWD